MGKVLCRLGKITGWGRWLPACFFFCSSFAQSIPYNFRHLTTNDGLSNGVIKAITQDKYGYTWVATASGICVYNGYSVKVFLHVYNDSLSVPDNQPLSLVCDKNNKIWVSFENGLYCYNYNNNTFVLQPKTKGIIINKMIVGDKDLLYCISQKGLMLFNTSAGTFTQTKTQNDSLLQKPATDIVVTKTGSVYLATNIGLVVYVPALQKAYLQALQPIANQQITKVTVDADNNTWVSYGEDNNLVLKANAAYNKYHIYKDFLYGGSNMTGSQVTTFFTDKTNHIWVATSRAGLCLYNSSSDSFTHLYHNPQLPMSLSSNLVTTIFQDNKGFMWTGTEGYGLNYFDPDHNLFRAITPDNKLGFALSDHWYRATAEDSEGNLWMGSMNGVVRYNKHDDTYTQWQNKGSSNQLYSNSIRSLLFDDYGYMWIGTADGLNRYNIATKQMDFFAEKDAMPRSFYWVLLQDKNRNIWIGCRDGLYRFSYTTKRFEHFVNDSLLAPYHAFNIISIFEDSQQRIWLGCYNKGVVMIDGKKNTVTHWMKNASNPAFINNNVRSFAEDKSGTIWMATNEGLAAYTSDGRFKKYQQNEGLKTLNVCALLTDKFDRIWMGSGNGLFVLDSTRKQFTSFSVKDGLPCAEFNEQGAYQTKDGNFVYPTMQGLITFNPNEYKENDPGRNVFVSGVNVFNKAFATPVNAEELTELPLAFNQNFFSLELIAPDYSSPQRTWFAYKLEPFDKDWIYTKDRLANYTNVPGGKYIFHYKASANKDNWNVTEKTMRLNIATIFYEKNWFLVVAFFLFLMMVYAIYLYRIQQSKKIFSLQNKAQLLEKEKAVVQYENLKQQLNPHFLFNSLTSLRSLIRIDKQSAADFLDKMSLNYRYILKSSESELVALRNEITFVKTYVDLQQTRFGEGLQVHIEVAADTLDKTIVPVTIQNLVDNAIKHNSLSPEEPLLLNIFTADNYLVVTNNLQLKENVETSNQHGLNYLISLYKYLDARPLIITQTQTHFSVKIPLI